jgi:hypothetical protein
MLCKDNVNMVLSLLSPAELIMFFFCARNLFCVDGTTVANVKN